MEAEKFPALTVEMPKITPSCDEGSLTAQSACTYAAKGSITIRDVTLPIDLTGTLRREPSGAIVLDGSTQLDWSAFGVKDPSILIAQVNELVRVRYQITLSEKKRS